MVWKLTAAHWNAPTPTKIKRIGNALVTLSTSVSIPTALAGQVWIGIGIAALGIVGKVLLAFSACEDDIPNTKTTTP